MKSSLFSGPCTCCFLGVPRKLFLHSSQRRAGCEGPTPRDSRCGVAWGGHAVVPFCYRVRPVGEKGRQTPTSPPAQGPGPGTGTHRLGLFMLACERAGREERPLCCRCAAGISYREARLFRIMIAGALKTEDPCYLEPESSGLRECMGTLSWPVPFSPFRLFRASRAELGQDMKAAHISLLPSPGALVKGAAIW